MLFYISQRSVNTEKAREGLKTQKGKLNMEETTQTTQETQETPDLETKLAEAEARAAKAEADAERFKKSVDKLTKEAADKKREERAKMSEDEKRKADQEEEFNRLREQAEADARELNHLKAVTAYKGIEEETVEKLIDAISDKDHSAISAIIDKVVEKAVKDKEAEWKKSRPAAHIGDGSFPSMTKAEIMAITDPVERQKKIAENITLFT